MGQLGDTYDNYLKAKGNPHMTINAPRATSPIDKNNGDDKIDWDAVEENALNNIQPLLLSRFQKQNINNSGLTNGVRGFYNFAQNSLKGTPYGKAMQIAGIGGDVLTMMGLSNDQQTTTDKILSGIPIIGNLTNIGGKKTRDYSYDRQLISESGASYGGLVSDMNKAENLAGKRYSFLSDGARRKNNRFIGNVMEDEQKLEGIMQEASNRRGMVSDLNYLRYQNDLNGNSNLRYARVVKLGGILQRVKQINFHKKGGEIIPNTWKPTITFSSNWKPVITFQNGGQVKNKSRSLPELIEYAKKINPRFIQRLYEPLKYVEWVDNNGKQCFGTHELSYAEQDGRYIVFPYIQEDENNQLIRYTDFKQALDNAFKNNDILYVDTEDEAKLFTEAEELENGSFTGYKSGWEEFFKQKPQFKNGGKSKKIFQEEYKVEDTNQKNIIPEGALHAHKHHMENAEDFTKKGIPVIDNDGEQQAEIERDEIIFTLEVTKALEDLYSKYFNENSAQKDKDEAAIEAGKLLVKEILFNTDDRTNLISKCEKGGVLNDTK